MRVLRRFLAMRAGDVGAQIHLIGAHGPTIPRVFPSIQNGGSGAL